MTVEIEVRRRSFCVQQLLVTLQPNLRLRSPADIDLPSFNFIEPTSMMTFLDLRLLIFKLGKRFNIRAQAYASIFLGIMIIITLLALAEILKFIHILENLSYSVLASIGVNYLMLLFFSFRIIIPAAFTNTKTDLIILRLFEIKHIVRRVQDCSVKFDEFKTLHENITQ